MRGAQRVGVPTHEGHPWERDARKRESRRPRVAASGRRPLERAPMVVTLLAYRSFTDQIVGQIQRMFAEDRRQTIAL